MGALSSRRTLACGDAGPDADALRARFGDLVTFCLDRNETAFLTPRRRT
jgi:hypothetical protein